MNTTEGKNEINLAALKHVKTIRLPPFDAKEKLGIEKKTFSTFDIREKLGIKIDRLKDWMNRGFISPSIQKASGQGTKNLFSRWDLYQIKLFQYLINRGFSRKDAAESIKDVVSLQLQMIREAAEIGHTFIGFVRRIDDNGKSQVEVLDLPIDIPLDVYVGKYVGRGLSDILMIDFNIIRDEVNAAIV